MISGYGRSGGWGGRGSDQKRRAREVSDDNVLVAHVGRCDVEVAAQREFEDRDVRVNQTQEHRERTVLPFRIPDQLCASNRIK